MPTTWFKSARVKAAIITGLVTLVVAVLAILSKRTDDLPTKDDVAFRQQMRDILIENQAINSEYADFRKNDLSNPYATFREIDTVYRMFVARKKDLLERLDKLTPTPRYRRLHSLMTESMISDSSLFSLEREDLTSVEEYLRIVEAIPPVDTTGMSIEQVRQRAFQVLMEYRKRNREWLDRAKERTAKEKVLRSNSSSAIQMLNQELERTNMPYSHRNVYLEFPESSEQLVDSTNLRR